MADTRFKKGKSGNPKGRPQGARNKITLLKESLELALREHSEPQIQAVLQKAIDMALEGSESMCKLILELHMSKGLTSETQKAAEKVEININGPSQVKKEESVPLEEVALLVGNGGDTNNGKK